MCCGVQKRFAFDPPKPDQALLEELSSFVGDYCRRYIKPLSADVDVSFEAWLAKTPYPKWRKNQLQKVYNAMCEKPLDMKEVSKINSFMKKETYSEYKYPRGINSRCDEFKCLFGPWIRCIEEEIYKLPEFIKHIPVKNRAQYVTDFVEAPGHCYVATDYSQYESHFTKQIMEAIEFVVYRHMTQNIETSQFEKCLKVLTGINKCNYRTFVVQLLATRMSGEMNTSLGNGVSNFFVTKFVMWKRGYTMEEIRTVVEGDDGLTRARRDNLPTADDFAKLGFTIKIEVFDQISDASFCGLIFDPDDKQVVTDPKDVLINFYWLDALKYGKASSKKILGLMRCKALSALYQYPGCPVVKAMAKHMLKMTEHVKVRFAFVNMYERELDLEVREALLNSDFSTTDEVDRLMALPIGMGTRLLVERKYGLNVSLQKRLEDYFENLMEIKPLHCPELVDLVHPDQRDYWNRYVRTVDVDMGREYPICSYL